MFNYWEPTHYLNHGYGLQTWEYSPEYAIRSWLYISVHALVGKLSWVFTNQKFNEFIYIRSVLGILCAFSELRLFKAVSSNVGSRIAFIMLFALVSSTGMFYASVAFLPSSFSMYTTMLGTAAFMDVQQGLKTKQGIMCFGIGTIVGWPFSAALILPLFADELAFLKLTGRFQETINRVVGGTAGLLPVIVRAPQSIVHDDLGKADSASLWTLRSMQSFSIESLSLLGALSPITSSAVRQRDPISLARSRGISIYAIFYSILTHGFLLHCAQAQSLRCRCFSAAHQRQNCP